MAWSKRKAASWHHGVPWVQTRHASKARFLAKAFAGSASAVEMTRAHMIASQPAMTPADRVRKTAAMAEAVAEGRKHIREAYRKGLIAGGASKHLMERSK